MTDNADYSRYWKDNSISAARTDILVARTDKVVFAKEIEDNIVVTGTVENYCLVSLTVKKEGGGNLVTHYTPRSDQDVVKSIEDIAKAINDVITTCADHIASEMFEDSV